MRSIFALTITFFILTACSQTPSPAIESPTIAPTNTPLPTQTPVPTATPTITPIPTFSPEAWAGTNTERATFLHASGQIDNEKGVAWNPENGRVYFAKDAKGEWLSYPDGNVPIPLGTGYENEPPLMVPYYHDFSEATKFLINVLPWGEPGFYRRDREIEYHEKIFSKYWEPILANGTWEVSGYGVVTIHSTNHPKVLVRVFMNDMQLPGGAIALHITYYSYSTDYHYKDALVFGDPKKIYTELECIHKHVYNNGASSLLEPCTPSTLNIIAPGE